MIEAINVCYCDRRSSDCSACRLRGWPCCRGHYTSSDWWFVSTPEKFDKAWLGPPKRRMRFVPTRRACIARMKRTHSESPNVPSVHRRAAKVVHSCNSIQSRTMQYVQPSPWDADCSAYAIIPTAYKFDEKSNLCKYDLANLKVVTVTDPFCLPKIDWTYVTYT